MPNNGDYGQLFLAKFGRNDDLNTSDISTSTLKIYPNPTKDKVYIKGFIHQDSLIEVYNLAGQKVIDCHPLILLQLPSNVGSCQYRNPDSNIVLMGTQEREFHPMK